MKSNISEHKYSLLEKLWVKQSYNPNEDLLSPFSLFVIHYIYNIRHWKQISYCSISFHYLWHYSRRKSKKVVLILWKPRRFYRRKTKLQRTVSLWLRKCTCTKIRRGTTLQEDSCFRDFWLKAFYFFILYSKTHPKRTYFFFGTLYFGKNV